MKIQPCPLCSAPGKESDYDIKGDEAIECENCELLLPVNDWNRLSLAVQAAEARMEYNELKRWGENLSGRIKVQDAEAAYAKEVEK